MPEYGEHKEIGQFIKQWRLSLDNGLSKFAKACKIKPSRLSRIERGFIVDADRPVLHQMFTALIGWQLFPECINESAMNTVKVSLE